MCLENPEAAVSGPQPEAPMVFTTAPLGEADDTLLQVLLELCGTSVTSHEYLCVICYQYRVVC